MGQITINNSEENKSKNDSQLNSEEPEKFLNEIVPQNLFDKFQSNILDEKKYLFSKPTNRRKNNIEDDISNANENSEKKIFEVIYRYTHDSKAKDNIKQSIKTSFINFLVKFINNIVFTKLNKKDIFYIDYKIKSKIKLADILKVKIKEILAFQSENNINNKNEQHILEIKKNDSSLNKLFETPAIIIFKEEYITNNQLYHLTIF